jgi:hypothetical protein
VQRLIGGEGDERGRLYVCRHPSWTPVTRREEAINQTVCPLLANRDRRREHESRLADSPNHFQAQYRLSRSRRRHQMEMFVFKE